MGELVDLDRYRHARASTEAVARVQDAPRIADPADHGWVVVERADDGRAIRWFHPGLIAQIGLVPNAPEWVFLDHSDQIRAWSDIDVGQVAIGLAARTLPEPEVTLRWDGTVVESR